jgi:hypothetical protein
MQSLDPKNKSQHLRMHSSINISGAGAKAAADRYRTIKNDSPEPFDLRRHASVEQPMRELLNQSSTRQQLVKFSVRAQNFILQKELASKSAFGGNPEAETSLGFG